ncbi:hypothetical protein [Actinoplanes sp. NPDC023714]|uniref:hypothetical protein n=1 Tax=Actinoplanes sp. NPDC023714 TaxID=3154322 RepID=UPI0033DDD673
MNSLWLSSADLTGGAAPRLRSWLPPDLAERAATVIDDLTARTGGGEVILSRREDVLLVEVVHRHREPITVGGRLSALHCGSHTTDTGGVLWAEI